MKLIGLLVPLIAIGCILTVGCVGIANKNTVNATVNKTIGAGFTSFTNSSHPGSNSTADSTTVLKGLLSVSINGYPANLEVLVDNVTIGIVNSTTDLNLMVPEGNHIVVVCMDPICEHENITTSFGRQVTINFGERLRKDIEFPNATARILDYYKNGNGVSVNVEFINPESVDHTISVELGVGYTYIDSTSFIKHGDSAEVTTSMFVKARQRQTKTVDIAFASSGSNYSFDFPAISGIYVT
jgi:hypothetical protein